MAPNRGVGEPGGINFWLFWGPTDTAEKTAGNVDSDCNTAKYSECPGLSADSSYYLAHSIPWELQRGDKIYFCT